MVTNAVMPDQLGGLQRYVRELASALVRVGVPTAIVTKRTSQELPRRETFADGVRIERYDVPGRQKLTYALGYPVATALGLRRVLSRLGGVVHVHYPLQGAAVSAAGGRYVHTFHAPIHKELIPERQYPLPPVLERPLVSVAKRIERQVAARASETVVLTEYMRAELRNLSPGRAQRAALIPAGIDTAFFSPGPGVDDPSIAGRHPVLFTARRLVPRTGILELVRAMPLITTHFPEALLVVAGEGQLRGDIEQAIEALSLRQNVRLLGRVSDEALRDWYRTATMFVLPTQQLEGFGMSTVEALACGTVAVGTPAGATPEVLGSLDERLIMPGTSSEQMAEGILSVLSDDQLLLRATDRARDHVAPSMSWSTIASRHLEIYEKMLAGQST